MRLWHKDLIDVLPNKMLLSQWRELSAIVGSINKNGTPNHRLVNIVLNYDKTHFYTYSKIVYDEMISRGMKPKNIVMEKIKCYCVEENTISDNLFEGWHNLKYLKQCYYNLEEKHDRGIVDDIEWNKIESKLKESIS